MVQKLAVNERERRSTAGTRMSSLVGKAVQDDDEFWNHSTWVEDEDGSFHESDEESDARIDTFDSDFNDSEDDANENEDGGGQEEADVLEEEKRAKRATNKKMIGGSAVGSSMMHKRKGGPRKKAVRGDGINAGLVLNVPGTLISPVPTVPVPNTVKVAGATKRKAPSRNVAVPKQSIERKSTRIRNSKFDLSKVMGTSKRSDKRSLRESTMNNSIQASASSDQKQGATTTATASTSSGRGGKRSRRKYTQEELILEAVQVTEAENERWILNRKRIQGEENSRAELNKKLMMGNDSDRKVTCKYNSKRGCYNTLTFPSMDHVPEIFTRPRIDEKEAHLQMERRQKENICVITGKKARYRWLQNGTFYPYHDLAAFKEIKKRLKNGEKIAPCPILSDEGASTKSIDTTNKETKLEASASITKTANKKDLVPSFVKSSIGEKKQKSQTNKKSCPSKKSQNEGIKQKQNKYPTSTSKDGLCKAKDGSLPPFKSSKLEGEPISTKNARLNEANVSKVQIIKSLEKQKENVSKGMASPTASKLETKVITTKVNTTKAMPTKLVSTTTKAAITTKLISTKATTAAKAAIPTTKATTATKATTETKATATTVKATATTVKATATITTAAIPTKPVPANSTVIKTAIRTITTTSKATITEKPIEVQPIISTISTKPTTTQIAKPITTKVEIPLTAVPTKAAMLITTKAEVTKKPITSQAEKITTKAAKITTKATATKAAIATTKAAVTMKATVTKAAITSKPMAAKAATIIPTTTGKPVSITSSTSKPEKQLIVTKSLNQRNLPTSKPEKISDVVKSSDTKNSDNNYLTTHQDNKPSTFVEEYKKSQLGLVSKITNNNPSTIKSSNMGGNSSSSATNSEALHISDNMTEPKKLKRKRSNSTLLSKATKEEKVNTIDNIPNSATASMLLSEALQNPSLMQPLNQNLQQFIPPLSSHYSNNLTFPLGQRVDPTHSAMYEIALNQIAQMRQQQFYSPPLDVASLYAMNLSQQNIPRGNAPPSLQASLLYNNTFQSVTNHNQSPYSPPTLPSNIYSIPSHTNPYLQTTNVPDNNREKSENEEKGKDP
jgi:hypothetical protein